MPRLMVLLLIASATGLTVVTAQSTGEPRQIYFDTRPIVEHLRRGDKHVRLLHPVATPAFGDLGSGTSFVAAIVERNPIIFAGRVVEKQPALLTLRFLQDHSPATIEEANWIGSRVTVLVDRVIRTLDAFPLPLRERFTFVDETDGSAVINGVRVDTETPWLWPFEPGRRYLITGRIKRDQFLATGVWMEPPGGGNMRAHHSRADKIVGDTGPPRSPNRSPFDDWTIDEASYYLEQEVLRRTGRQ